MNKYENEQEKTPLQVFGCDNATQLFSELRYTVSSAK
jgi:hypothetical protein